MKFIPISGAFTMPRLSCQDRCRAVGRLEDGDSPQQVAIALDGHICIAYRLQSRFQAPNTTDDLPRSGRPRMTTPAQDRHLVRQHRRDPHQIASDTARNTVGIHGRLLSDRTVGRRFTAEGLHCRRPSQRPVLTPERRSVTSFSVR